MTPRKTLILAASFTSAIALAAPAYALGLNLNIGADGDIDIDLGAESSGGNGGLELGISPDDGLTLDGNIEGEEGNPGLNIDGNIGGEEGNAGLNIDGNIGGEDGNAGLNIFGDIDGEGGDAGLNLLGNIEGEGGDATVNVGGNVDGEGTDIFGDADADARLDAVLNLIRESMWEAETELRDAADYLRAEAHSVGAWLTAETEAMFQAAVEEYNESISNLREAIAANASLSAWLESEEVDVDTVVALGVTANGELVAFTE